MAKKTPETIREETRDVRCKLYDLSGGKKPSDTSLRAELPGDKNRPRTFKTWEKNGLWPPSPEELAEYRVQAQEHVETPTPVAPVDIPDNAVIHRKTPETITPEEREPGPNNTVIQHQDQAADDVIRCIVNMEIPETSILFEVKKMLAGIEVAERPGDTAPGRKSKLQTQLVAARFPVELITKLDALGGKRSHHLERSLMLYLKAMDATDPSTDAA